MATWKPDPSFYPSPKQAMDAPPEKLAYVAVINPTGDRPDSLAVVDVDPQSPGRGQVLYRLQLPFKGDELHHFGWNACSAALCPNMPHPHLERRYLLLPGLRSSRLYVVDTERMHLRVFDVRPDGSLTNGRVFFDFSSPPGADGRAGVPDGLKVDECGNVYCTGPSGIWVLSPDAEPLGLIHLPEPPSNLNWAGHDWSTLYITACSSVYRVRTRTTGNRPFIGA